MDTLNRLLHNNAGFIKEKCPELYNIMQKGIQQESIGKNALQTGFTDDICIENLMFDEKEPSFRADSVAGFTQRKGTVAIISELIDEETGSSIAGNAVTDENIYSIKNLLRTDLSSYAGIKTFKPKIKSVFYWTETDENGEVIMKTCELEQRYFIADSDIVESITVDFPDTKAERDHVIVLYGRNLDQASDKPDVVFPDVRPINNQLPIFMPFIGTVRLAQGKIVGVDKDESEIKIKHPEKETKVIFNKEASWVGNAWSYFDNSKALHWEFENDWKNNLDLRDLSVSSIFDFSATLGLKVLLNNGMQITVPINIGSNVASDGTTYCKVKKLLLQWGCLGKDSLILMADGSQKKICEVCVGDKVATDKGVAGVTDRSYGKEEYISHIVTESGKELLATDGHHILTERGWLRVIQMNAADRVVLADGSTEALAGLFKIGYGEDTYNLVLDSDDGCLIANGIVVGDYGRQNRPDKQSDEPCLIKGQEKIAEEFRMLMDEINKKNNWI